MEEIVIYKYKANDGTMFDDEDECLRYELEQTVKNSRFIIRNAYGELMNLLDIGANDALNNASYVTLETEQDLDAYNNLCEYYGYQQIKSPGNWYYDYDKDEWISFDNLTNKVEEMKSFFQ